MIDDQFNFANAKHCTIWIHNAHTHTQQLLHHHHQHRHHNFFRFMCVRFFVVFFYSLLCYFFYLQLLCRGLAFLFHFSFVCKTWDESHNICNISFRFEFEWHQKWCDLHTHTWYFKYGSFRTQSKCNYYEWKKKEGRNNEGREAKFRRVRCNAGILLSIMTARPLTVQVLKEPFQCVWYITYRHFQFKFLCMLVALHSIQCVRVWLRLSKWVFVCVWNDSVFFLS